MQKRSVPSSATRDHGHPAPDDIPVSSHQRAPDEPLLEFRVGAITVVPLVQFHYRVDPRRFFPDLANWPVDPSAWYWQPPYVIDGRLSIDMGGFLVRSRERTILVDAGVGNHKERPNPHFHDRDDDWLTLLERTGVEPSDVDTVVFTHLHVDHVGFATSWDGSAWRPTFPRARHLVAAAELDFWTSETATTETARLGGYIGDSVLPLERAGVLDTTTGDIDLAEEIRLVAAPGHTPGNMCVEVSSEGERAVFVGDMVHHAIQLAFPGWSTDYCIDYDEAAEARDRVLASLDADDLLFAAHFPDSAPGRVTPASDGGYRFVRATPVARLSPVPR